MVQLAITIKTVSEYIALGAVIVILIVIPD